jgi:hypothetical protein
VAVANHRQVQGGVARLLGEQGEGAVAKRRFAFGDERVEARAADRDDPVIRKDLCRRRRTRHQRRDGDAAVVEGIAHDRRTILIPAVQHQACERHVLPAQVAVGSEHAFGDRREPHVLHHERAHRFVRLGRQLLPKSHNGAGECALQGTIHGTTD